MSTLIPNQNSQNKNSQNQNSVSNTNLTQISQNQTLQTSQNVIPNQIQLMTYPDSLGGNLVNLKTVLDKHLKKSIGFVHILPPYLSSADRGFAPLTHLQIEPKFGNWQDIIAISNEYGLMLDIIAGHVSVKSEYFQDYLKNGENSQYYDMFMRVEKTFEDGIIRIEELTNFGYLTPIPPLILFKLENGESKLHFKTFMPDQADLDVNSPVARELLESFVKNHAKIGVKMVRLDAIETVCKDRKLGYHLVPQTFEVLAWIIAIIKENGMEVLCEVFGSEELKNRIVQMGAWIYDFNLPDVVLHAVLSQKSQHLKSHFSRQNTERTLTVLTNHDGFMIGRILQNLTQEEANFTRTKMLENAGSLTQKASGIGSNNVATDGINATLIQVLFRDQEKWLICHLLHLFAPGIPQMYYNDLLAELNDERLFEETGEGRSLIRHNFEMEELNHTFERPVIAKLLKIMEFRNNYKAFLGQITVPKSGENQINLAWEFENYKTELQIDLFHYQFTLKYWDKIDGEMKVWGVESTINFT